MKSIDFITNFVNLSEQGLQLSGELPQEYRIFDKIVFIGTGSAGIVGEIAKDWLSNQSPVPLIVVKEGGLPQYVDRDSLVFLLSYSGDTEEMRMWVEEAFKRECKIVGVSSGGVLSDAAERNKLPLLSLPPGMLWGEVPLLFFPVANSIKSLGIKKLDEHKNVPKVLKRYRREIEDTAIHVAQEIRNTLPFIYGSTKSTCMQFKTMLNTQVGIHSTYELLSRFTHGEVSGWKRESTIPRSVVIFNDNDHTEKTKKAIRTVTQHVRGKAKLIEIYGKGRNKLERMFYFLCVSDMITYTMARNAQTALMTRL